MDWTLLFTTFATIFIAEFGDKTQLAAMSLSAGSDKTNEIILGVVGGLAMAGLLGIVAGKILSQFITPEIMKWVSGCLFILIGIITLVKK
jgi:putative Ca2+/H+ antiporter (TMEM165/GDT1 family)